MPHVGDYIYWDTDPEPSAERIVDRALPCKPIALGAEQLRDSHLYSVRVGAGRLLTPSRGLSPGDTLGVTVLLPGRSVGAQTCCFRQLPNACGPGVT